ncbi:MAG: hypothetical protein IKZ87_01210 [Actinomycetaceae bacterium]|nr:hypothetical protein [Actinomycetaceae bacterium]
MSKKFAFKIGDENRPRWMRQRHLQRFADDVGVDVDFLRGVANNVCENIMANIPDVSAALHEQVKRKEGIAIIEKIEEEVRRWSGRIRTHVVAESLDLTSSPP